MTARLEFGVDGNDGVLHLQFLRPRLEAGLGACRLGLEYQIQAAAFTNGVGIMLSGECRCRIDTEAQRLGTLHANAHPFVMHRGGLAPSAVELSLSLSFDQLWALEQARAGQDLQLMIHLYAAQIGKLFEDERSGPYSLGQHEITIPASRWADFVTELGAAAYLPILVPLPLGDPESRFGAAGRHVQQAWRAVTEGRWEDAIRTARLALA